MMGAELLSWMGMLVGLAAAAHLAVRQEPRWFHWPATFVAGASVLAFAYLMGGAG